MLVHRHVSVSMAAVEGPARGPVHGEVGPIARGGVEVPAPEPARNAVLREVAAKVHVARREELLLPTRHGHGVRGEHCELVLHRQPVRKGNLIPIVVEVHVGVRGQAECVGLLLVYELVEQTSLVGRAVPLLQRNGPHPRAAEHVLLAGAGVRPCLAELPEVEPRESLGAGNLLPLLVSLQDPEAQAVGVLCLLQSPTQRPGTALRIAEGGKAQVDGRACVRRRERWHLAPRWQQRRGGFLGRRRRLRRGAPAGGPVAAQASQGVGGLPGSFRKIHASIPR
mmetsp:Transcript_106611/g.318649  ORF Transcript_106611/g.318649 Transcript_106611/m.318649 type:complete len:281 (-) Transcript_106611:263-1105(-)